MLRNIESSLNEAWRPAQAELLQTLGQVISDLEGLLQLEEYHRHGHDTAHLQEALGPFGATSMDLEALSRSLGEGAKTRHMTEDRRARISGLLDTLREKTAAFSAAPPACTICPLDQDEQAIHEAAEIHLNDMASLFRAMRIAQLEIKAKYQPQRHDAIFMDFNWRHLSPGEIRICPPFIVKVEMGQDYAEAIRKMMSLLTSRKPIKILALRKSLKKHYPASTAPKLPATVDIEMFPLAMRGVYTLQATAAQPNFTAMLSLALGAARPGILSIFWPDAATEEEFEARSERALLSRSFPAFVYDPDAAQDFVSCFSLAGNPEPEREWGRQKVLYFSDDGNAAEMERNFTFANYAAEDEAFAGEFTEPPAGTPDEFIIPLSEFLALNRNQRVGRIPYVTVLDHNQRLVRMVPSQDVITQAADRRHLWNTLQEFAGIGNPHVHAARTEVHTSMSQAQDTTLRELRESLEKDASRREKTAVALAVRNITAKLTGVDPSSIPLEGLLALAGEVESAPADVEAQESPAPKKAVATGTIQAPAGEGPWIETGMCTACDECITINDRIFAYNEDKKAVIANPKGGPFKDIVRAAEKCSADIIHPGKPLDPSEKDLDKWIKRAERYQ